MPRNHPGGPASAGQCCRASAALLIQHRSSMVEEAQGWQDYAPNVLFALHRSDAATIAKIVCTIPQSREISRRNACDAHTQDANPVDHEKEEAEDICATRLIRVARIIAIVLSSDTAAWALVRVMNLPTHASVSSDSSQRREEPTRNRGAEDWRGLCMDRWIARSSPPPVLFFT
eukprot:scaffold5668_cov111-Isochrysis_galbana.AAC.2